MMDPDDIADALSWLGDSAVAERADAVFAVECEAALRRTARPETVEVVDSLSPSGRRRILRAPEVTRRTLFTATAPDGNLDRIVLEAALVEHAIAGGHPRPASELWSALGDARLLTDGSVERWPHLDGDDAVPLDFGSPWAFRVDLTGQLEINTAPRPALTPGEIASIFGRVRDAMALLSELTPTLPRFVNASTCVLVLQPDPGTEAVASGTNGRYVGRSFVANPQKPSATLDCMAEAIVHEAIHGMIFREALRRPWVDGEAALEVQRVPSPWTGRPLPVRSYLEASFVWYGLVHLWSLALQRGSFERDAVQRRLGRSLGGFCRGALVDRTRPWRRDIRDDVLDTVDRLQSRVVDALGKAA